MVSSSDLRIPLGPLEVASGVTVAHRAIARLAAKAAYATYGVVGMQTHPIRRLARFFQGSVVEGVEIDVEGGRANIGLHVVLERGVNLAQVTENLREQVQYQLGQVAGLPLGEISIRVEDLRD